MRWCRSSFPSERSEDIVQASGLNIVRRSRISSTRSVDIVIRWSAPCAAGANREISTHPHSFAGGFGGDKPLAHAFLILRFKEADEVVQVVISVRTQ